MLAFQKQSIVLLIVLFALSVSVKTCWAQDDEQYTKLTKAILNLHERLSSVEKDKSALQSQLTALKTQVSGLQSQIKQLKSAEDFDRSSLKIIHSRLNILDARSGSIVFPNN